MSDVAMYAVQLADEIGPRPAGTEEEQQAAFFLEDTFKRFGLDVEVEEFNCNLNSQLISVACCAITFLLGLMAVFVPILVIPAMILCFITAVVFIVDSLEIIQLPNVGKKGLSQNVVARYVPASAKAAGGGAGAGADAAGASGSRASRQPRQRKIIFVSHYDTGKMRKELKSPILEVLPIIYWVEMGCMFLVPLAMLMRLAIGDTPGVLLVFINILTFIGIIGAFLVVLSYLLNATSSYSDGANCNASGVAVMAEVAKRIAGGKLPARAAQSVIHGAGAAYAAGLVPEGASLVYEDATGAGAGDGAAVGVAGAAGAAVGVAGAAGAAGAAGLAGAGVAGAGVAGAAAGVAGAAAGAAGASAGAVDLSGATGAMDAVAVPSSADAAAGNAGAAPIAGASPNLEDKSGEVGSKIGISTREPSKSPILTREVDQSYYEDSDYPASYAEPEASQAAGASLQAQNETSAQASPSQDAAAQGQFVAQQKEESNVPDWYKRAMSKANKSEANLAPDPSQRSKYSDALDAAALSGRNQAGGSTVGTSSLSSETEQRLQAMRESIMSGTPIAQEPSGGVQGAQGSATQAEAAAPEAAAPEVATPEAATPESAALEATPETREPVHGVGGYLSSILNSENYETSLTAEQEAAPTIALGGESAAGAAGAAVAGASGAGAGAADAAGATAAAEAAGSTATEEASQKGSRKRRSISLPSLTAAIKAVATGKSSEKAAAETVNAAAESGADTTRAKKANLAASLPGFGVNNNSNTQVAINQVQPAQQAQAVQPAQQAQAVQPAQAQRPQSRGASVQSPSASAASISASIPAISDSAQTSQTPRTSAKTAKSATDSSKNISISQAGSFASPSATGTFAPLTDDFISDIPEEDVYIDDADDSSYEEQFTDQGALAGPGYVDMPKSRAEGLFGRLRKKNKKQDVSFNETVGVGDDYDAYQVGKNRGSWGSFREDQGGYWDSAFNDEDEWNGGAYREGAYGEGAPRAGAYGGAYGEGAPRAGAYGSAAYSDVTGNTQAIDPNATYTSVMNESVAEMREDIHEFHSGSINMEVWFVALGAELAGNAGMKEFMRTHADDLRGAVIIDIEALGAGELTMVETEGKYRLTKMSSRLKRYVKHASNALGIHVGTSSMNWTKTAAHVAEKQSCQTLHLAGFQGGKPAFMAERDDVIENLDDQTMEENAAFLIELVRSI